MNRPHFVGAANAMTQCDLSACKDFEEIVQAMKTFRKQKENYLMMRGLSEADYDQNFLGGGTASG